MIVKSQNIPNSQNSKIIRYRFRRRLEKYVLPLMNQIYIDYQQNYKKTIFLAGTERSGTTWISDIINYKNEYRYIFEPFWPHKVTACKNFRPQQYIRPDNMKAHFINPAQTILSGNIRNKWADQYHRKFISNKRLIKDIRANLFLKWINNHFPEIPIVLLLRHPCAVARSYLRRERPYLNLEGFLKQDELMNDFLNPFKEELFRDKNIFDTIIFTWCIQNYVPLKQFKPEQIHVVFYESFCETPENEIRKMFTFLRKPYDKTVFRVVSKPSLQSFEESAIISGNNLIDSWREYISDEQIERAVEILSLFGLNKIYSESSTPNIEGAMELLAS